MRNMALRVSPERVRDVRFAEQWRGYRTDEVDDFVDRVAEAFDELEARLEEAAQRTALAERRLQERGPDEELSRTLVLAQRTADAALEEAKAEASRVVGEAEEKARSILHDVEARKAELEHEMEARARTELAEVSERRAALQADVEALQSYVDRHRSRMLEELRTQLRWLEGAEPLEPLDELRGSGPPPSQNAVGGLGGDRPTTGEAGPGDPGPKGGAGQVTKQVTPAVETGWDDAEAEALAGREVRGDGDTALDDTALDDRALDDRALDDLDSVPWGDAAEKVASVTGDDTATAHDSTREADGGTDDGDSDDPFIAELRRAVDDPEPLGPRDEPGQWVEHGDIYDRHREGPMRSRRRRRKP